jgi:hypothetical protein
VEIFLGILAVVVLMFISGWIPWERLFDGIGRRNRETGASRTEIETATATERTNGSDLSPAEPHTLVKSHGAEFSWVQIMLSLIWILCFIAALLFGIVAVAAATNDYGQGEAFVFTAYAISLTVSGIVFAAIGKIIAALTSVDDNLRLLVRQNAAEGVPGKEVGGAAVFEKG